jgi:PAS domain S-box-containing protein
MSESELWGSGERPVVPLVHLAYDAIFTFVPPARINYWAGGAERLYGWSAREALGKDVDKMLNSTFDCPRAQVIDEVIRKGRWAGRILRRRKDGTRVVIDARCALLRDADGKPSAIAEVNRDVTAEHDALEREAAKTTLLELATEAIFTFSLPESEITYWNGGAARMYGWPSEEALGRQPYSLLNTEHDRPRLQIMEELLRSGQWAGTMVQTRRDGTKLVVDGRWSLRLDESGRPASVLEVNRDMTKERAAEVAKSNFLNLVGHQLRTPLALMKGYVSLIANGTYGDLPTGFNQPVKVVTDQLGELERLIESVLVISRLGQEDFVEPRCIDLGSEVEAAIQRARARSGTMAAIAFNAPRDAVVVDGDSRLVGQIMDELIDNALGHSTSRDPVVIWLTGSPKPSVYVRDHGVGIAIESHAYLFERFGRRNLPQFSTRSGLGLGLYLCKRLALAMGGDVTLETSSPGAGSTFRFSIRASSHRRPSPRPTEA